MRIRGVLGAAAVLAVALAGCSRDTGTTSDTAPALPDGITMSVYQGRSDLAERRLQVSVANRTPEALTITGLSFDSEQFAEPAVWQKETTTIAAGATADLPVLLPAPACADDSPAARVRLEYLIGTGVPRSGSGIPSDPAGRLPELRREDCFAAAVLEHAGIALRTPPRDVMASGRLVAELDLTITPTGEPGTATIDGVLDTVLLSLVDTTGARVDELPIRMALTADSGLVIVTLLVAPGRCDSHAIAEDKRGTILPVRATTETGTGILFVSPTDDVRRALYDFVQRSCALDPATG